MKTCITTAHLYGMGGGAKAVFWIAKGLRRHGPVTVFTRTPIPESVIVEMPKDALYADWYPGCSLGYDVHVNVDHFHYEEPQAGRNIAYIFHPHRRNMPPTDYELWAVSAYTAAQIADQWDEEAKTFYVPIDGDLYCRQKERRVLHVSRFSAPNQYADKGHRQMIHAFKSLRLPGWEFVLAGSTDPAQAGYLSSLMADASGANIHFAPNFSRKDLVDLFAKSSIYWHMTGVGMPDIPGAQEHLGITTIEAMAAGCVPIVRGTGGQTEIVHNHLNGITVDGVEDLMRMTSVLVGNLSSWSLLQQQAYASGTAWKEGDWYYNQFDGLLEGMSMTPPLAQMPSLNYGPGDVDVIIPIYNSSTIHTCLDSLPPGPHVIVVDNGSDEPVSHPRIDQYVRLEENLGFAGGNMAGFQYSQRPVILALNDDCFAPEKSLWLTAMLLTLSQEKCAVVGAKLIYPDGRLQHTGLFFDFHREDIGYHRLYGQPDLPEANLTGTVPAVTGACLMCKREFFDMCPDLYPGGNYEDAHLCLEAWRQGYEVWYQPAAELVHVEAATKRSMGLDYVHANRTTFINHWRAPFLDAVEMTGAREANNVRGNYV